MKSAPIAAPKKPAKAVAHRLAEKPAEKKLAAKPASAPAAEKAPAKKPVASKSAAPSKPSEVKAPAAIVQTAKSAAPVAAQSAKQPAPSGNSRMVLMLRDPKWLCVYWDLDPLDVLGHKIGALSGAPLLLVRVIRGGAQTLDYTVFGQARTWYIPIEGAAREYCAELGYIGQSGGFVTIARSNELDIAPAKAAIQAPDAPAVDTVSPPAPGRTLEIKPMAPAEAAGWATPAFESPAAEMPWPELPLAESPVAHPGASEQSAAKRGFPGALGGASESLIAPTLLGQSSELSPGAARAIALAEKERGFWLLVATELIIYGATEPDARVTIAGEPVDLRPDGTFSLRFALPDGRLDLPVHAVSHDGIDERTITPVVEKETR